jgi:hypothetical protein
MALIQRSFGNPCEFMPNSTAGAIQAAPAGTAIKLQSRKGRSSARRTGRA